MASDIRRGRAQLLQFVLKGEVLLQHLAHEQDRVVDRDMIAAGRAGCVRADLLSRGLGHMAAFVATKEGHRGANERRVGELCQPVGSLTSAAAVLLALRRRRGVRPGSV
jgi:hypothetical protein